MADALKILKALAPVATVAIAGATLYQQKRAQDQLNAAQAAQSRAVRSLAPPPLSTVKADSAEDTRQAKAAADEREKELQAGIKADTEKLAKARRLSLVRQTIKTAPYGLKSKAPVEFKSLLGEGAAY